jgi:hypothetical protein
MGIGSNLKEQAVPALGAWIYPTVKDWVNRFVGGIGLPLGGVDLGALIVAVGSAYAMDRTRGNTRAFIAGLGIGAIAEIIRGFASPSVLLGGSRPVQSAPVPAGPEAEAQAYIASLG